MSRLFVDVDTQGDFINPKGALYVPGAEKIRVILAKITKMAKDDKIEIIKTMDEHDGSEPEMAVNGGPFPLHCMACTEGQAAIIETGTKKAKIFTKRCYNVFDDKLGNPEIDAWLKKSKFTEAYVYGLCGNICVEAMVMGLIARGIETFVFENAVVWMNLEEGIFCKGIDNKELSIARMRKAGAHFAKAGL